MVTSENQHTDILTTLQAMISERAEAAPETSYTASLLAAGVEKCAQKAGEEAVEFVIAAVSRSPEATRDEAADLVYHLLVTLQACGVSLDDVLGELERRQGTSGLAEKASRNSEQQR